MAALGRAALLLSLGLVVYAFVAGAFAAGQRRRRLALSAQNALLAAFASTAVAAGVLLARSRAGLLVRYVSEHTSRGLPLGYTLSAFWGGQEGSLLLWLLILTGYAALAVWLPERARPRRLGRAGARRRRGFFAFCSCFVASPFATAAAPADGAGLTPSLQNPYMVAHPPMLYLGYVGLTVPFAFAMGALLSGRIDERWIVVTRRWTLSAWMFLGVGQLLGAHWAYVEVGWGGYYAWDPVKNAALMPWLAATAFLHSVMIQEKRGMLKVWNMVLVALAFWLSIFGTFLTRSGVVNSIHSFSQSPIGAWFLGFIGVVAVVRRDAHLRAAAAVARADQARVARLARGDFLYNNLLLVALCLTILWGVAYPLLTEAVRGETRSVVEAVLRLLPAQLRAAAAPADGDRATRRVAARLIARARADVPDPAGVATSHGRGSARAGAGSSTPGLIAYTFSAFVAGVDRARVRARDAAHALSPGRGRALARRAQPQALRRLRRPRGDVLLAIGIAGSSAYQTPREPAQLLPGQSMEIAGYTLTYEARLSQDANAVATRATLDVSRGGHHVTTLHPGKEHATPVEQMTSNEVSIYHDPLNLEDLFMIADQIDPTSTSLLQGARQAARQPDLGRRLHLRVRLAVAMWPDAQRAPARPAVRGGRRRAA